MQHYTFGNYEIKITEKSDFDNHTMKYPNLEPFFWCKQIHSSIIHERHPHWTNENQGDGILTDQSWIWLKVGVSDCNPVAIMGKQRFGIVHAGWKGIQGGIIQTMFEKLKEKGESDFCVFVWPSIRKCCYEVGDEFSTRCDPKFLLPKENGKIHLDMLGMMQEIFENFSPRELFFHPECTKCGNHFFSYRKQDWINNFIMIRKNN